MKLTTEEEAYGGKDYHCGVAPERCHSAWEQFAWKINTELHPSGKTVTQHELRTLIPQLIRTATGRDRPQYGVDSYKPKWWPSNVPWASPRQDTRDANKDSLSWTEALRAVVYSCYKYHGQEHLLGKMRQGISDSAQHSPLKVLNTVDGTVAFVSPTRTNSLDSAMEAHVPVMSAGPYPTGAFMSMTNGDTVADMAGDKLFTSPGCTTPGTPSTSSKTFVEIFICFFCEKEFKDRPMLQEHQESCVMRPAKPQTPQTRRPLHPRQKQQCRPKPPASLPYRPPDKTVYIESLGLLPTSKVDTLKERNRDVEVDCIDLDEELVPPKTPTTPRSAKSLISQLSRDLSPTVINRTTLDFGECKAAVADSDSDSESSRSEDGFGRPAKASSLLAIDLCSLLGQRVKRQVLEAYDGGLTDPHTSYEVYCHTPKKNNFLERLRHRQSYWPVTYRKKRCSQKEWHMYKFSRRQRREFMTRMRTGLSSKSRALQGEMRRCRVLLHRMSEEEVAKWTEKRLPIQELLRLATMEMARWKAKRKAEGYVFPVTGSELRRLLGARTQMELAKQAAARSLCVPYTGLGMHQKLPMYKTLLMETGNHMSSIASSGMQPWGHPGCISQGRFYGSQGGSRGSSLSAYLAKARKRRQSDQSDDVISISSCDSGDENSEGSNGGASGRRSDVSHPPPIKKQKLSPAAAGAAATDSQNKSHAVLFKCHLCYQEILFNLSTTDFIKNHFADKHNVHNIQILEHRDQNNQVVLSIVEDNKSRPPGVGAGLNLHRRPAPASVRAARATRSKAVAPPSEVICID